MKIRPLVSAAQIINELFFHIINLTQNKLNFVVCGLWHANDSVTSSEQHCAKFCICGKMILVKLNSSVDVRNSEVKSLFHYDCLLWYDVLSKNVVHIHGMYDWLLCLSLSWWWWCACYHVTAYRLKSYLITYWPSSVRKFLSMLCHLATPTFCCRRFMYSNICIFCALSTTAFLKRWWECVVYVQLVWFLELSVIIIIMY